MAERLIFHYHARDTLFHRLDPRTKLILVCVNTILIFIAAPLQLFVVGAFVSLCLISSRLSPTLYLREFRMFAFLVVIIVLSRWIGDATFLNALLYGVRFFLVVLLGLILSETTAPEDLTLALYWFLRPFRFLKPKQTAARFSLMISFLPILLDATLEISEARKARLDDPMRRPLTRIISIGMQVFELVLQRAEELSYALESRCYQEDILYGSIAFKRIDVFAALLMGAMLSLVWIVRIPV